jgi:hypothetical protein
MQFNETNLNILCVHKIATFKPLEFHVFICGLFDDAFSSSDYIASNENKIHE